MQQKNRIVCRFADVLCHTNNIKRRDKDEDESPSISAPAPSPMRPSPGAILDALPPIRVEKGNGNSRRKMEEGHVGESAEAGMEFVNIHF